MPKKKNGNINAIISNAPAELPIAPRVYRYAGMPIAAAALKHISWRFVRFSAIFVLTFDKSFGTVTNAIG